MKKGLIYSLLAGIVALLSACGAQLQAYNFNDEYATSLHYEGSDGEANAGAEEVTEADLLVGVPARSFYGGDLKRGGIWWATKGVSLEKGDVFTFTVTPIAPDSGVAPAPADVPATPFGATFPPLDLVKEDVVIKISARSEAMDSTDTNTPVLHLQLDDASGYMANSKRPSNKIESGPEFKEYFFTLKDVFVQSTPKKHSVNGAMINSVKFFITPGYSGKIFIKEIKVVPAVKP